MELGFSIDPAIATHRPDPRQRMNPPRARRSPRKTRKKLLNSYFVALVSFVVKDPWAHGRFPEVRRSAFGAPMRSDGDAALLRLPQGRLFLPLDHDGRAPQRDAAARLRARVGESSQCSVARLRCRAYQNQERAAEDDQKVAERVQVGEPLRDPRYAGDRVGVPRLTRAFQCPAAGRNELSWVRCRVTLPQQSLRSCDAGALDQPAV